MSWDIVSSNFKTKIKEKKRKDLAKTTEKTLQIHTKCKNECLKCAKCMLIFIFFGMSHIILKFAETRKLFFQHFWWYIVVPHIGLAYRQAHMYERMNMYTYQYAATICVSFFCSFTFGIPFKPSDELEERGVIDDQSRRMPALCVYFCVFRWQVKYVEKK